MLGYLVYVGHSCIINDARKRIRRGTIKTASFEENWILDNAG